MTNAISRHEVYYRSMYSFPHFLRRPLLSCLTTSDRFTLVCGGDVLIDDESRSVHSALPTPPLGRLRRRESSTRFIGLKLYFRWVKKFTTKVINFCDIAGFHVLTTGLGRVRGTQTADRDWSGYDSHVMTQDTTAGRGRCPGAPCDHGPGSRPSPGPKWKGPT